MQSILFVHNGNERFVLIDLQILTESWQVTDWYENSPFRLNPLRVFRAVQQNDLIFCWFASWHAVFPVFFAKMLGKPSVVVIGGYDTANIPAVGYGSQRGGIRRLISRFVIQNATHLVTFSNSALHEIARNSAVTSKRISMIYLGIDPLPLSLTKRKNLILTVGGVWQENLLRKGLLPFVQTAKYLPDFHFVLVGKWNDNSIELLKRQAMPNVEFTGYISDEDLLKYYQQAAVYVQASLHEGFGMSVAEAMSAGCIPVVTRTGSLPEVVGDIGIYANSNEPVDLADAIRRAYQCDEYRRVQVRERVVQRFSIAQRKAALNTLISKMAQSS